MSNRRERNWRKAKKRRDKLLAGPYVVPGFKVTTATRDFGSVLCIALERDADGLAQAVAWRADRLWRRMERLPGWSIEKLLRYFNQHPLGNGT